MRYALIMTFIIRRCFEIPIMLTLQNISVKCISSYILLVKMNKKTNIIIGRAKPNSIKISKTIVEIPSFI